MTGTDAFSADDLVAFIGEQWSPLVLQEFFAQTVAADFFVDLAEIGQRMGADIFHVPDIYTNDFTVQTQSTAGAEVTLNSPTSVDVTLSATNHVYIAYILADLQRQHIAASYNITQEYTRKAGGRLADDLEDDLLGLWSGLTTNVVGDTASVITDAEVRQSVEALDSLNIPVEESAWFFHPYSCAAHDRNVVEKTSEIAGNSLVDNPQPSPYWEGSTTDQVIKQEIWLHDQPTQSTLRIQH